MESLEILRIHKEQKLERKRIKDNKKLIESQTILFPDNLLFEKVKNNLDLCGRLAIKKYWCKKDRAREHVIKEKGARPLYCENRFCSHIDCLIARWVKQFHAIQDNVKFKGLRYMEHFSLSFAYISRSEFKKDYSDLRSKQSAIVNDFFKKLRAEGIEIQGIRALDFKFLFGEGKVRPHFHFGVVPVGRKKGYDRVKRMKELAIEMSKKNPSFSFVYKTFGLKKAEGVQGYIAKRSVGLFDWDGADGVKGSDSSPGKLRRDIQAGKYFTLDRFISFEEYMKNFYNRSSFSLVGDFCSCRNCKTRISMNKLLVITEKYLDEENHKRTRRLRFCPECYSDNLYQSMPRHGSILTHDMPTFCTQHGELKRSDVRLETCFQDLVSHPPNNSISYPPITIPVKKY